jgi:hypothetical protein
VTEQEKAREPVSVGIMLFCLRLIAFTLAAWALSVFLPEYYPRMREVAHVALSVLCGILASAGTIHVFAFLMENCER